MGKDRHGASGADIVLKVPVGTQIYEEDGETLLADLTEMGQRAVLARGHEVEAVTYWLSAERASRVLPSSMQVVRRQTAGWRAWLGRIAGDPA